MIASHYDEDHIAGLVGCLHNYAFGQVICPDYEADTEIFQSFLKGLEVNGAEVIHPQLGEKFTLGNATITIIGSHEYVNSKDNNNSIVVRIVYGDYSCIITGDDKDKYSYDICFKYEFKKVSLSELFLC